MTYYGMNDPYGKGPLFDVKTNKVTYLRPDPKDYVKSNAATDWRTSIPHVNYNGHYVDVIKSFPIKAPGRIDPCLQFLFLPNEKAYYKFHSQSIPRYLVAGVRLDFLLISEGESSESIKRKFTKLSKSSDVIALQPYSLGPFLHKLTQSGGDPEGLLKLLDTIVDVSERNLNSPPSCPIL